MPKARQHPDDEYVEKPAGFGYTVAAERNIHIIPEPRAKRHMPAAPKFRNAPRNVRVIEVFEEIKAEDFAESDRHIAVTREVEINVQRKRNRVKPKEKNGFVV